VDRRSCGRVRTVGFWLCRGIYGYPPRDIARLAPDRFHPPMVRGVTRWMAAQLYARFPAAHVWRDGQPTLVTHPPRARDRQLVGDALALCTPWGGPDLALVAALEAEGA
jgi:hypothetical protein